RWPRLSGCSVSWSSAIRARRSTSARCGRECGLKSKLNTSRCDMLTNEDLKNLDRRAAVPAITRTLLRRAVGLELLEPTDDAELVTELKPMRYQLKRGETFAGYDFEADIEHCKVVLVTEEVNYPIAGYPEAYIKYDPEFEQRFY